MYLLVVGRCTRFCDNNRVSGLLRERLRDKERAKRSRRSAIAEEDLEKAFKDAIVFVIPISN